MVRGPRQGGRAAEPQRLSISTWQCSGSSTFLLWALVPACPALSGGLHAHAGAPISFVCQESELWSQAAWRQLLGLSFASGGSLGKDSLSVLQFPHLLNGDKNETDLLSCCVG